jgi:hypothetical protein
MSPRASSILLTLRQLGLSVLAALLVFGGAAVAAPGVASAAPDPTLLFEQLGLDIDGEATDDYSGWSVALSSDGTTLAISAPRNDGGGHNAVGHVRVYTWDGDTDAWVQQGGDIDGEAAGDQSGWSVALSADGNTLAIGAPFNDNIAGHVRVYIWDGDTDVWVQQGVDIDGEAAFDWSGFAVALSGDGTTLAIGAPFNDNSAGHVRVYIWDGVIEAWVQQGGDIDGEAAFDWSGYAVAMSSDGTTLAIGAPFNDNSAGHVRVYIWDGDTDAWVQQGGDIDGEAAFDESGYAVAMSSDGTTLAIGAPGNDVGGDGDSHVGHVRVYIWDGDTDAWVQQGVDIDGEGAGDYSGYAVALSSDGTTLAIGAPLDAVGHVRVYVADAPVLVGMPEDLLVEAAGSSGTTVDYTVPTATDRADSAPVVSCVPASGSLFPIGTTTVTCTATDSVGNSSAATFDVTVDDTVAPATTLVSGPSGTVTSSDASFTFSTNEASTFSCKLDSGSYASCTSPTSYSGLAAGGHTFRVRATDRAGNVDASPAARSWTVSFPEFKDSRNSVFADDIGRLAAAGITKGCNPPANDRFCPDDFVTRGQMAAFLTRALSLPAATEQFSDVATTDTFAAPIGALAAAGITKGCNSAGTLFCPDDNVTRGQMAAFLTRALSLPAATEQFRDVATTDTFAAPIGALAKAGITKGCNPPANDRFCPDDFVTRGQMAAFLVRAGLAD